MRFAALFALFTASLFADPKIKATISPGPWAACSVVPDLCLMQAPGLELWFITVQTDATADVGSFQADIGYALTDGTPATKTIVFKRDEQPYGIDASTGSPIYYTAYFVALGKVSGVTMTVTGLKSAGLSVTTQAKPTATYKAP